MSQPVKLSSELVLEARTVSNYTERSIAKQIEYWAQLGRSIEPLLRGDQVLALRKSGHVRTVEEALETAVSEKGQQRVRDYFDKEPYPHFEESEDDPNLIFKIDEDGKRTQGRFVNRKFVEIK